MKLIVGLGNPGAKYTKTRHNLGRRLVEFMASRHHLSFSKKKSLEASLISFEIEEIPITLAYPETFMNLSGKAVAALVQHLNIHPSNDLLVAVDDLALPLGRLRLRAQGTDGGHNGLKSVEEALGTSDYPRLRLGIGSRAPVSDAEAYVLSPFEGAEEKSLGAILRRSQEACLLWLRRSISAAMNVVNRDERGS